MTRLQLDVDLRLVDVWAQFRRVGRRGWTLAMFAAFLRAAYAQGYRDGQSDGGRLIRDNYPQARSSGMVR